MAGDIFTLDTDNNAAVRTISVKAGASETNSPVIFTKDADGNAAVRVMGGAGSIDEDRIIIKSAEIPAASEDELGKFYCYSGVTNQNFVHGYVYECVKSGGTYTGTVSFEAATLSGTTVACSGDDFANFLTESGVVPLSVVSGTMTYDAAGSLWVLVGKDENEETVLTFQEYQQDYEDFGFTFTGTPEDGDVIAFTCSIEESGGIYTWTRINLQPGSEHDLGFFDTVAELQTAHPTGIAGDFALIGATDTFWVWDTTTSAWVDSHKTDAVTSVNGQTGAVVLTPSDVGAATAAQGAKADTAIQSVKTINGQSIVGEGNVDIDALPSQTGHAGKVLTTDGTDASWETPTTITMRTWGANE